MKRLQIIN